MIEGFLMWMLYYSPFFLALPITIALVRFRFLKQALWYIVAFLGLSVLAQILAYFLTKALGNNLILIHFYTVFELNIIALFYHALFGRFYPRWLVPSLMVFFTVFAVVSSIFFQKLTEFNTYARGLECVLVIVFSMMYFYKMLIELNTKRPEKCPIFWINTGFLFYFAGSLVLFILSNAILNENKAFNYMSWGLHACVFALLHIFIGIGLWYSPRLK
ncbi:hypothetical protein [Runella zeae]|jgi:hypothetical protein|uniref:hypothetical protein n=1 Tax=Runella zeae TaxID=94255 RepID=UPI002353B0C8|nr:hypothetical protein [Runella zeae]